jgi:perosamine synthetase
MRHTPLQPVTQQRRGNYRQWAELIGSLGGAKALFPELPPDCTPYMFALRIDRPEQHFYQLKHLGLPIWRWDEMAASACPVSTDYRLHLLHLPCHQSLSQEHMQWMLESVRQVLT